MATQRVRSVNLTEAQIRSVDHLSSREAAIALGVGKTSVQAARHLYSELNNVRGFVTEPGVIGTDTDAESYHEVWKGNDGVITVVIREQLTHEAILRKFGHDPERVFIDGVLEETHWQYNGVDWNHRYKFKTSRLASEAYLGIDPVGILAQLRAQNIEHHNTYQTGVYGEHSAFVISINDLQLGQSYNGGSDATISQFHSFIVKCHQRIDDLRAIGREIDTLIVIGGGDLVEGCVIYGNQAFNLDLHRKQQIEGVVALIMHALDELAPRFAHVKVLAAKGNHGENRIEGKSTTIGDNDDTHAFEMVKLAMSRDQNMRHIEWVIAGDEASVAMPVFRWVLATTHGDIYAKHVAGPTIDKKAHNWMKNMSLARSKFGMVGLADVLVTHHFHHVKSSDWGSCFWIQSPSQDRGSPLFEQASGEYSQPGMLTFVMTESVRFQDLLIIR